MREDGEPHGRLDGCLDGRLDGRLDGSIDGRLDGSIDGRLLYSMLFPSLGVWLIALREIPAPSGPFRRLALLGPEGETIRNEMQLFARSLSPSPRGFRREFVFHVRPRPFAHSHAFCIEREYSNG